MGRTHNGSSLQSFALRTRSPISSPSFSPMMGRTETLGPDYPMTLDYLSPQQQNMDLAMPEQQVSDSLRNRPVNFELARSTAG